MSAFEEAMFKMHEEKILKEAERNKTEHELKLKFLKIEHNKSMELKVKKVRSKKKESRTKVVLRIVYLSADIRSISRI